MYIKNKTTKKNPATKSAGVLGSSYGNRQEQIFLSFSIAEGYVCSTGRCEERTGRARSRGAQGPFGAYGTPRKAKFLLGGGGEVLSDGEKEGGGRGRHGSAPPSAGPRAALTSSRLRFPARPEQRLKLKVNFFKKETTSQTKANSSKDPQQNSPHQQHSDGGTRRVSTTVGRPGGGCWSRGRGEAGAAAGRDAGDVGRDGTEREGRERCGVEPRGCEEGRQEARWEG